MENNNEPKRHPPRIIVKIANLVVCLGLVFSCLIIAFSIYRVTGLVGTSQLSRFYQITLLVGLSFAALFVFGLRLTDSSKVNLALLTLSITVPILGFETYLEFSSTSLMPISAKTHLVGSTNDTRTKIEVIDDFRSNGIDAYPNVSGSQFISTNGLTHPLSKQNIYPLGAIANKITVYCNESGEWAIFESDEHGFNNPKGLYRKNSIDIMMTGDSFAEGACVNPDESIASILRESEFNVISLGKGGNGPLLEFASLKEYVEPLRPKVVLWLHYANDIIDLSEKGISSAFLMNYLNDEDFSQNLISRQDEIDDVLKVHINREYRKHKMEIGKSNITMKQKRGIEEGKEEQRKAVGQRGGITLTKRFSVPGIIEILKLTKLRQKFGLQPSRPRPATPTDKIFQIILKKANEIVTNWDGRLYLVYLHSFERYKTDLEHDVYFRDFVLQVAAESRIPVIDVHREVFIPHEDPLSLFPGRKARHYNAEGYRLIAEAVSRRLRGDGLFQ